MRHQLLCITLILMALTSPTQAQDNIGTRLAAAERYAKTFDIESMTTNMLAGLAYKVPTDKRDAVLKRFKQELSRSRIEAIMINAMVQIYNTDELSALANFYDSPQGQAILRKMPLFVSATTPAFEAEFDKIADRMGISKR